MKSLRSLRALATMCRSKSVADVLLLLGTPRQELHLPRVPRVGDYTYRTLFIALEASLDALDATTARRCEMLAIFPEDTTVPLDVVRSLWGASEAEALECAETLADVHLIDLADLKKYQSHFGRLGACGCSTCTATTCAAARRASGRAGTRRCCRGARSASCR